MKWCLCFVCIKKYIWERQQSVFSRLNTLPPHTPCCEVPMKTIHRKLVDYLNSVVLSKISEFSKCERYKLNMLCVCVCVCRPCPAAGARGDAEAEGGGGQAERWAEGQSPGDNHHLQRGGGGKETQTPTHDDSSACAHWHTLIKSHTFMHSSSQLKIKHFLSFNWVSMLVCMTP